MKIKSLFIIPVIAAMLVSSSALAGCEVSQDTNSEVSVVESEVESTVSSESTSEKVTNNLTGLSDLSKTAEGKRPVAVMINNIEESLPQYGISSADVMFETLVEGGITRMMAIYADYTKVPDVCSVRSCRYYYPILAQGLDAIYFHAGIDKTIAEQTINELGIDHYDSDERLFSRDQTRLDEGYATEHTLTLHGAKIAEVLEADKKRTTYNNGKDTPILNFNSEGTLKKASDGSAETVNLQFSPDYYSTFTFDKNSGTYLKQHNGKKHVDSSNNQQLAYTNVFALETTISVRDDKGHMDVDWKGGTGYYFSDGTYQKIKWSKSSEDDNIKIYDESGKELSVNAGKSYFGILKENCVEIK